MVLADSRDLNQRFEKDRRKFMLTSPCERACPNYRTISKNKASFTQFCGSCYGHVDGQIFKVFVSIWPHLCWLSFYGFGLSNFSLGRERERECKMNDFWRNFIERHQMTEIINFEEKLSGPKSNFRSNSSTWELTPSNTFLDQKRNPRSIEIIIFASLFSTQQFWPLAFHTNLSIDSSILALPDRKFRYVPSRFQ